MFEGQIVRIVSGPHRGRRGLIKVLHDRHNPNVAVVGIERRLTVPSGRGYLSTSGGWSYASYYVAHDDMQPYKE